MQQDDLQMGRIICCHEVKWVMLLFFKKINLGYFRFIKLCRYMRFNENRFYYRNFLKSEHCFLEEEMDCLCIWIVSCLRNVVLPYYIFFLIQRIMY